MKLQKFFIASTKFTRLFFAITFVTFPTACGSESDIRPLTGEITKSHIAFTDDIGSRLWIARADGSNLTLLNSDIQSGVKLSPDGTKLAFKVSDGVHMITDLEGDVLHTFAGCNQSDDFCWTPSGHQILYGCYNDGLWRYDLADESLTRFYTSRFNTYDHNPVLSPDQTRIVFTHHEYGKLYTIVAIDPDGGNALSLATGTSAQDAQLDLDWLDNTHVFFDVINYPTFEIHSIDLDANTDTGFDPGVSFTGASLTRDKNLLALYGANTNVTSTSDLSSGSVRLVQLPHVGDTNTFAWSEDGAYFIAEGSGANIDGYGSVLSIFDKSGKEYKFLTSGDFPGTVNNYDILAVDWGSVPP